MAKSNDPWREVASETIKDIEAKDMRIAELEAQVAARSGLRYRDKFLILATLVSAGLAVKSNNENEALKHQLEQSETRWVEKVQNPADKKLPNTAAKKTSNSQRTEARTSGGRTH